MADLPVFKSKKYLKIYIYGIIFYFVLYNRIQQFKFASPSAFLFSIYAPPSTR